MVRSDLVSLLESTSVQGLKSLIAAKEKLDELTRRKASLEKDLAAVCSQIQSLQQSLGRLPAGAAPAGTAAKGPGGKGAPARARPRAAGRQTSQPSIQSLIVDLLTEKGGPLTVNQISQALLTEKMYRTTSANFKNQLRVLLYRNQKGLFHKVAEGTFALAATPRPAGSKPAPPSPSAAGKKTAARAKAARKTPAAAPPAAAKKTAARAKTPRKAPAAGPTAAAKKTATAKKTAARAKTPKKAAP